MEFLYDLCGIPFGFLMRIIYLLVDNYAIDIIIFTILTRLILFPISYRQQINTVQMQRLNPKLEKLRQKYKDDAQKLQEAQQRLYTDENVNPGASCLPMFLQFFLLFGILDVVYKPLTFILRIGDTVIDSAFSIVQNINPELAERGTSLRQELTILQSFHESPADFADVFGSSLSERVATFYDQFSLFGVNLGTTPSYNPEVWNFSSIILFIIPLSSGIIQLALTIYTQIMQRHRYPGMRSAGCMNVMLYVMPIFSVWFAFQVPAGVGFYWTCSSFFSLLQAIGLNLWFTDERVDKILEKRQKKVRRKAVTGSKFVPRPMNTAQKAREEMLENQKNMSKSELAKFQRDRINEARRKMAEEYGDTLEPEEKEEE